MIKALLNPLASDTFQFRRIVYIEIQMPEFQYNNKNITVSSVKSVPKNKNVTCQGPVPFSRLAEDRHKKNPLCALPARCVFV